MLWNKYLLKRFFFLNFLLGHQWSGFAIVSLEISDGVNLLCFLARHSECLDIGKALVNERDF